jgi:ABC-type lipopolysaccharide export system ATPase subunit
MKSVIYLRIILFQIHFDKSCYSIGKEKLQDFYADEMIQSMLTIKHLSGGELRYLEIKLILNNSSKFVLLDDLIMVCHHHDWKINELITAMSL